MRANSTKHKDKIIMVTIGILKEIFGVLHNQD